MADMSSDGREMQADELGSIPGLPGEAAFTVTSTSPSALPVLIAVPHAGRAYPPSLTDRMRHPRSAALRLEDRYADLLGEAVAKATGAALLVARAPRAMIDLNRASDDVDWDMFEPRRGERAAPKIGPRARSGLGLIPRRIHGLGEIWKRRHAHGDLTQRIAMIHTPYHDRLARELGDLRGRWGAALLVDLHSMPPLGLRGPHPPSEFVIGDRFGASCHGTLVASAFGYFAQNRRPAAHNRPYAGGYVLDRHAGVDDGIHALQLEVDRSSYLDGDLTEPGPGFNAMVVLLSGLVTTLAAQVADLGRSVQDHGWADAAE